MKKIGILGGTFNPIHSMHIEIARRARDIMALDQIIFIPSANPPHKSAIDIQPFCHRIKMVELAIEGIEGFFVSNIENKIKHKKSYTVDTLKALKLIYPKDKLYFIVGSDCVFDIEKWYRVEQIFKYCELVVFERPDISNYEDLKNKIKELEHKYKGRINLIGNITENISSSEIRQKISGIQEQIDLDSSEIDELDEKILNYILKNNLYRN